MSSLLASTHDTISDSLDGEAYKILKEEEELLHERSEQRNNEGNEVEVRNEPNQITQYLYIGSKIAAWASNPTSILSPIAFLIAENLSLASFRA